MLLRNFDTHNGLGNGTRVLFEVIHYRVLKICVFTDARQNLQEFIPKMIFISSETRLPFSLQRYQFSVILFTVSPLIKARVKLSTKKFAFIYIHLFSP